MTFCNKKFLYNIISFAKTVKKKHNLLRPQKHEKHQINGNGNFMAAKPYITHYS